MSKGFATGNASGSCWFLGTFIDDSSGLLKTDDIEVNWSNVPKGTERGKWGVSDGATSMTLLIRGKFHIRFKDGEIELNKEGDYAIWPPGAPHYWKALEDAVTLTIRWPSVPKSTRNLETIS